MSEKNKNRELGMSIIGIGAFVLFMIGIGGFVGYFTGSFVAGISTTLVLGGGLTFALVLRCLSD